MADVDPETLLEWLQMGQGDERDMQLIALEQLCMLLLMSDNVDRVFERYVDLLCYNNKIHVQLSVEAMKVLKLHQSPKMQFFVCNMLHLY